MKTLNVSLVGVGGQGILLTANMLAKAASLAGLDVKKSEIHGMAQRGGSVVSQVRIGSQVHSPIIPEGATDVLVAFDKLEALRWAHVLAPDGKAVVNNAYLTPVTVSSGQQKDVEDLDGKLEKALKDAKFVDAAALSREAGNERTMNMVIAGALSAMFPLKEEFWTSAMDQTFTGPKAKLLDLNKKAFALGRAAVA